MNKIFVETLPIQQWLSLKARTACGSWAFEKEALMSMFFVYSSMTEIVTRFLQRDPTLECPI